MKSEFGMNINEYYAFRWLTYDSIMMCIYIYIYECIYMQNKWCLKRGHLFFSVVFLYIYIYTVFPLLMFVFIYIQICVYIVYTYKLKIYTFFQCAQVIYIIHKTKNDSDCWDCSTLRKQWHCRLLLGTRPQKGRERTGATPLILMKRCIPNHSNWKFRAH